MQKLRIVLILILGSALMLSLISARRDRQELEKVTAANDFLRKNTGEMPLAMSPNQKQLDRLQENCPH